MALRVVRWALHEMRATRTEQEVSTAWPWDVGKGKTSAVMSIEQEDEDGKQECRISDTRRPGKDNGDAHAVVSRSGRPYSEWAPSYMVVDTQNAQERASCER